MVEVKNNQVHHIWGNPHSLGGQYLCPRGAAGKTFEYDDERPQFPMLRDGERGSGKWKQVSWDEALDFVADKLQTIKKKYGAKALVMSDRGGPHREFHKTFLAAYGSPNYFNHHATCSNSIHNAHKLIAGYPRNGVSYDYGKCKHFVTFGRNILESLGTGEAKKVIDLLERGSSWTHIDVRWNFTAAKATESYIVRPQTDYTIAMAILRILIKEKLYDAEFVEQHVNGLAEFEKIVEPFTPQLAEKESGMPAKAIIKLAYDLAEKAPNVLVYPGYMTAWGAKDYYLRRALYSINALLGTYGADGGMKVPYGPGDVGVKIKQLTSLSPKPETSERFDGIGTTCKHLGKGWGLGQLLPQVAKTGKPYPIKAYWAMRHDPAASLPDPEEFKEGLDALDLVVSLDVNWSETGWYADVILPECTFLERTDNVMVRKGPKPKLGLRQQAIEPRFDTKPRWWIFRKLAEKMGLEEYFPYTSIEEHIAWQLEGTGISLEDFAEKGEVPLTDTPVKKDFAFKTKSGKFELITPELEECGIPSWIPFETPDEITGSDFRLITGKVAVHTQGRTTANNALLNEIVPSNKIHIHPERANELGIKSGDEVSLKAKSGKTQTGIAKVTDLVHKEIVFMLHGFGDSVPLRTRSYRSGVSDMKLAEGALVQTVGGNCPLTDKIVAIEKV